MFAKVSDKFHARKQAAKAQVTSPPRQQAQLPSRPAQPAAQASRSPPQSPPVAQPASQPQPPAAPVAKPQVASPPSNNNGAGASPMEGIEGPPAQANALSHSLSSAATGSSASSSLSAVPPQDRTLSSALGVQGQSAGTQGSVQPEVNRTMSIEMADVSTLSIQNPPDSGRQGSSDEDRIREKAREAQEQAQANLHNATQQARVAAIHAAATQAALDTSTGTKTPTAANKVAQPLRKTAGRYALADFAIERTLGTGSFGRVHLVRSKHNGRFYAVKVLNKEKVVKMKQVEHTNSEREMLVRVRHPFLVNLWGTFQDANNLYMVMDFVAGGELFSLLRKSQRFPNSVAKFYAAEVALALDYLHSLDIIYRDLKPENLLLGADGHVKVTDFGFAKHVPDITWTLCGTPDYLAPEVVQSKGYNKSVDWYALGVLIFEMLIIAGKVRYPTYFDNLARELLKNLLVGDLTKRYGNLRNGSADIFGHGWFAEVDWDKLYRREIPAPYVPKIDGEGDASQFDRYQEADVSSYGKSSSHRYGSKEDNLDPAGRQSLLSAILFLLPVAFPVHTCLSTNIWKEVQMLVFGFPSKLCALQFEWAWQHPELSRHLHVHLPLSDEGTGQIFKKDARRNRVDRKAVVALALLRSPPFNKLPLHVRCFASEVCVVFDAATSVVPPPPSSDLRKLSGLPPLNGIISITVDREGLHSSMLPQTRNQVEVSSAESFQLDVADRPFRSSERVVGKWRTIQCQEQRTSKLLSKSYMLTLKDPLSFSVCLSGSEIHPPCTVMAHLDCLAKRALDGSGRDGELVPQRSTCIQCGATSTWGEIIRGCYSRRDDSQGRA
ncbi:cAMP-dependent protein kinase type 1 [Vanrija pseudolonga]|uniref:cAMP-dependent protein kinase n=1 Tax=Vanrija pseudolonga TaxID=143232 RepID=A0AAF1BQN7_9TREE|nr:cAMP-dependent protein kinase type 1 [Vanrija pseudolonga]